MKRLRFLLAIAATLGALLPLSAKAAICCAAEDGKQTISYLASDWTDTTKEGLWTIDESFKTFDFYADESQHEFNYDDVFVGNFLLTDQFADIAGASVEMSATFNGTTSSEDILEGRVNEVHIGLVPWYLDENNWAICYAKYCRCSDVEIKDGHLFDVQIYVKLDGSTHVDYYVKDDGDCWIPKEGSADHPNSEWHSAWPDRVNKDLSPSTLQATAPDPSKDFSLCVKKTRKTYAGRECDAFTMIADGYELNFGLDNFMFSGLKEKEDQNPDAVPSVGFYLFQTKHTVIKNLKVAMSHEVILPLPTVEPIGSLVNSGSVNTKIVIPDFAASDSYGRKIPYEIEVSDPDGEKVYLDGENFFIPTKVGYYEVLISATDEDGYTGTYSYRVKSKSGTNHIDSDVYDDAYTVTNPKDISIPIAYAIFISVPSFIAVYIAFKVFFYFRKKGKGDR